MVFFAYLLILEYLDHLQNLISSSLYYPGPLHKIHPNPFITFWVMLPTNRQTNATKKHNLLCQEVLNVGPWCWRPAPKLLDLDPVMLQLLLSFLFIYSSKKTQVATII